jgi:hypothetical protein
VKKQEVLQENVEFFASLYRYLQDRPSNEANKLFERIRDGFSIEAAFEFMKAEGSSSTLTFRDPPSPRVEWTLQLHDCKLLFENDLASIEASDVLVQALRHGVHTWATCSVILLLVLYNVLMFFYSVILLSCYGSHTNLL